MLKTVEISFNYNLISLIFKLQIHYFHTDFTSKFLRLGNYQRTHSVPLPCALVNSNQSLYHILFATHLLYSDISCIPKSATDQPTAIALRNESHSTARSSSTTLVYRACLCRIQIHMIETHSSHNIRPSNTVVGLRSSQVVRVVSSLELRGQRADSSSSNSVLY